MQLALSGRLATLGSGARRFDLELDKIPAISETKRAEKTARRRVSRGGAQWGGRLTALIVEGKLPAYAATAGEVDEVKREKDAFFKRVLDEATKQASERGIELRTELVPGHAAEVITHYAEAHGHDLIVIGHRGHFCGDYLLGSTADRVSHHAHCPVIVVR